MGAKKRILGIVFGLGIVLCLVGQLRWLAPRAKVRMPEAAPTNAVEKAVTTNAVASVQTNAVAAVPQKAVVETTVSPVATNVVAKPKPRPAPIANDPKIPKARQVLLANRRIAVEKGRSFPKQFCAAQTPTARGTAPYVVISEAPVSRDVRIRAMADGSRVIGFLPNNALLVEADAQALKNLEEDVLFTAAVEYEPTDKIQRALLDGESGERVEATVVLMNPEDRDGIRDFVMANGGAPIAGMPTGDMGNPPSPGKSICATVPRTLLAVLAGKAEVKWIERYARMKIRNDVAVRPGLMDVEPVREAPLGLSGEGQVITTSDSGIDTGDTDTMHADLTNAVIAMWLAYDDCRTNDVSGHGTHTAGSLVGDGTMSGGKIRGAAPGAKLWAWFCDGDDGYIYPPMYDDGSLATPYLFRPYFIDDRAAAAYVHSASWGGGTFGAYSDWGSQPVDAFVWGNPDFLPVFSAGNEGDYYGGSLAENTVGQPATAKNALTVGASENLRPAKGGLADNPAQIVGFSSCGPCEDGRIKPDIVAPGSYVLSCLSTKARRCGWDDGSHANYQYMGGTSMACPLTAGAAALVREWLVKHRERANPSAALVKAVLTGGATDLYGESGSNVLGNVPDTRQGWGRVDLAGTLAPTNGMATFLADGLPFAAGSNFTFRVTTTNAAPLNVQLVWVDYPGEPEAAKALVNDLDLRVTAGAEKWLGNGGTEPDDVNNVESVRIRDAAPRTYAVRVKCSAIPYDHAQGGAAAIYIRGAFDPATVVRDAGVGTAWLIR